MRMSVSRNFAMIMTTKLPKIKNAIDGILLLDKPLGLSSNAALQRVKHLWQAKKAGHTGSLDPLASGMLPLCFGEATKFSQYLLDADKTYYVQATLGIRTATGDAEGELVQQREVPALSVADLDRAFETFRGESWQVPSMFSALKYQGKPLYELARRGIEVERAARPITIYQLHVISYQAPIVTFEMRCSKGTYVRNVVEDLGEQLGCGAHVSLLRRTGVGSFTADTMVSLATLTETDEPLSMTEHLLPLQRAVAHLPLLTVSSGMAFYLHRGQPVQVPQAPSQGLVGIQLKSGEFIGVGEIQDDGLVAPRRLIAQNQ